jgi:hypothetical protein
MTTGFGPGLKTLVSVDPTRQPSFHIPPISFVELSDRHCRPKYPRTYEAEDDCAYLLVQS